MTPTPVPKPPWQQVSWLKTYPIPVPDLSYGSWKDTTDPTLKEMKDKIAKYESHHVWERAKKMANSYEIVYTQEDPHFHPSLCLLRPLSRSQFKLIEIMEVMRMWEKLPKQNPKLRTAHIAEGPGGFIQAVIERAEHHHKVVSKAVAMTLKPTDSRVPGWRRASAFLHKHREVKLHYGADGTGDIYIEENQDSFVDQVQPGGVHLFTADGGFDFSIDYSEQEHRVYRLLVSSALIGLRSLQKDGMMVLKVFDCFSGATQLLLSLLGRQFQEWTLYKPAMSRPCNSERYFLGVGYRGNAAAAISLLQTMQAKAAEDLYPTGEGCLQEKEMNYFETHNQDNTKGQIVSLERAIQYAERPAVWQEEHLAQDFQTSMHWCQAFRVPWLMKSPGTVSLPAGWSPPAAPTSSEDDRLQSPKPDACSSIPNQSDRASPTSSQAETCPSPPVV